MGRWESSTVRARVLVVVLPLVFVTIRFKVVAWIGMDPEEDFNRFRYRARVQAVAVIDIVSKLIVY